MGSYAPLLKGTRGAAIFETTLVTSLVLMLMLATIRTAVLGYYQLTMDAAAFVQARDYAQGYNIGRTATDANTKMTDTFPGVSAGTVASVTAAPPKADVPVTGYGFGDANNRFGGYSLMQGTQSVSTITSSRVDGILPGVAATVNATSVEPVYEETHTRAGIDNSKDNDYAGQFGSRQNYFTNGENTPPYFIGFRIMHYCPDDPSPPAGWGPICSASVWRALGTAEFLDKDNWGRLVAGLNDTGTFFEAACHERVFATIAKELATPPFDAFPVTKSVFETNAVLSQTQRSETGTSVIPSPTSVDKVYMWDAQYSTFPTDFSKPYPVYPAKNC